MPARDDASLDTDRTLPGISHRDLVVRGLEEVLDGMAEILEAEIEHYRKVKSKSDPPPDDGRPTWPSAA